VRFSSEMNSAGLKAIVFVAFLLSLSVGMYYFSSKNTSERQLNNMLEMGDVDIEILKSYLDTHDYLVDWQYDKALNIAALVDDSYLKQIIKYYADGSFSLSLDAANRIITSLPSDSIETNLSAGRIYSTDEFGLLDLKKSVKYLELSALRGSKDAAEYLAVIYKKSECLVEAATWSKIANTRKTISECGKIIVDINRLNEGEWDSVLYNVDAIRDSYQSNIIANIKYSANCDLNE